MPGKGSCPVAGEENRTCAYGNASVSQGMARVVKVRETLACASPGKDFGNGVESTA